MLFKLSLGLGHGTRVYRIETWLICNHLPLFSYSTIGRYLRDEVRGLGSGERFCCDVSMKYCTRVHSIYYVPNTILPAGSDQNLVRDVHTAIW